ncbi:toxin YdaT family protein [Massilia sp. TN1-12]|uniref:toxin YdaT family protein n=1 Tax=Massilia paldalensis TaxID=3377675 RepID=UPI00384A9D3F
MKTFLQKHSLVDLLRVAVESWRRDNGQSRETVAIEVMEAHERMGAAATTGITFDSSSKDLYTKAKSAAQKLYRWFGGDDEQDAKLPANMLPSILAALPMEQRLEVLNQILLPLGVEARQVEQSPALRFDVLKHLRAVMKEGGEGQMALVTLPPDATPGQRLAAHRELVEASQAFDCAATELMAEISASEAVAAARGLVPSSK